MFEGNIDFYGKSGFVPGCEKNIAYWGEPENDCVPYFLCKNLVENYIEDNLRGRRAMYHTPDVYLVNDSDVEEFDRKFAAE